MADADHTGGAVGPVPRNEEPAYVAIAREGALARAGTAAWRLIGIGVLLVAALWLVRQVMPVLLPAIIALMLATLLTPAAAWLRRHGVPTGLATALSVLLVVLFLALAIGLIVPPVVDRLGALGSNVEEGLQRVAFSAVHDIAGVSRAQVNEAVSAALDSIGSNRGRLVGGLVTGATALASAAAALVLVLFLTFFLTKDGARLGRWLVEIAPKGQRSMLQEFGDRAWRALTIYVHGIVFVATVDAVFIGIALVLVGVDLPLPLIVLTFLAAFFPIIGAIAAGLVSVLVAFVSAGPAAAAIIAVVIVAVQQLEGNVLYPAVVGPRLRLHPIAVLLSVTFGATVAGIPGAFLAVPVASVAAAGIELRRERLQADVDTRVQVGESIVLPGQPLP